MQKGEALDPSHHILRYIRPRYLNQGEINGEGFLRRPQESASSVNWLEYFNDKSLVEQIEGVKAASSLNYSPNGLLARLNIGLTKDYITRHCDNPELAFIYDPTQDPTHSLILNIPEQDTPEAEFIKDLLVHCVKDTFKTKA